jgi:hypothetical protein
VTVDHDIPWASSSTERPNFERHTDDHTDADTSSAIATMSVSDAGKAT